MQIPRPGLRLQPVRQRSRPVPTDAARRARNYRPIHVAGEGDAALVATDIGGLFGFQSSRNADTCARTQRVGGPSVLHSWPGK